MVMKYTNGASVESESLKNTQTIIEDSNNNKYHVHNNY
jgi:hypothetical protein